MSIGYFIKLYYFYSKKTNFENIKILIDFIDDEIKKMKFFW